ncbi:MAG: YncE family protein [Betaproteobacteria bacterium]|nr:YncE family protein [Betaproteobacteria bacterium]
MIELDCRGLSLLKAGSTMLERYNACAAGERFDALADSFGVQLRIWLMESGAKYEARPEAGGWRVSLTRCRAPAQGTVPGVHHVLGGPDNDIWACVRGETVLRIDGASCKVVERKGVAKRAAHLALDAERRMLFVADPGANAVVALDAKSLEPQARWDAPGGPQLPLVTGEGIVCVTGGGSGTLTVALPRGGGYESRTIEVGTAPHDPIALADGRTVFVPCAGDGALVKVDAAGGRVLGRIAVGDGPVHLAASPDGSRLWCANCFDGTVTCVSVEGEVLGRAESGRWAHAIDAAPDGRQVYVGNFYDDTVSVFDAETLERMAVLPTEVYAHGIDASPDGQHVVATGFSSDSVRVYDAAATREAARIEVGAGSTHTAFSPDGQRAYVACALADHVAVIDLAGRRLLAQIRIMP